MNVGMTVCPYAFLNAWTNFDDIFCECLGGSRNNLDK